MNPYPPLSRVEPNLRIARKLQGVYQHLTPLSEQGNIEGFFNNVENADQLRGLVEDIRDAIMDYQVYPRGLSISCTTSLMCSHKTSLQQDIYNKSCQLIVSFTSLPFVLVANIWVAISGPRCSRQDVSHPKCWISFWKQAGVPEGNEARRPLGDRTLVD